MQTHLSLVSGNQKVGPIPVSTSSAKTCPPSCPLAHENQGGCYAEYGPLSIHWRHVTNRTRGTDFNRFCRQVAELPEGQLWRHNQAGDLPGLGDHIHEGQLKRLVDANKGKRGFTYTHKPVEGREGVSVTNRYLVRYANKNGFTVNLSADNLAEADQLLKLRIAPVVTVLSADTTERMVTTPAGNKVAVCPATYDEDVSCSTCQLCQRQNRKVIVGFPAHGTGARKASAVAS